MTAPLVRRDDGGWEVVEMRGMGLLLAAWVLLAGCSTAAGFDFATDDLCEWVSADEVAGFVEDAFDVEVSAELVYGSGRCEWRLVDDSGREAGWVGAEQAIWRSFDGVPYDMPAAFGSPIDYAESQAAPVAIGAAVSGHPALGEGVVVHNGGFGQFAFGVPPREQYLQVSVGVEGYDDWDDLEPRFFAVADDFMEALGWLEG